MIQLAGRAPLSPNHSLGQSVEVLGESLLGLAFGTKRLVEVMARSRRATFVSSRARPLESVKCVGQVATTCNGQRKTDVRQRFTRNER